MRKFDHLSYSNDINDIICKSAIIYHHRYTQELGKIQKQILTWRQLLWRLGQGQFQESSNQTSQTEN